MATGFAISVKLVDLASGPLAKINKAIFGVEQTSNKTSYVTRKVAKDSLPLVKESLRDIGKTTKEVGEGLLKAFAPFETLAIGASLGGIIGGLGYLAQNFAAVGSSTQRMSQSLGLNIVDLQNWRGAADLAGVGADAMTSSLQGLSHGIYMARAGLNPDTLRAAQQFGIDLNKGATDAEKAQNVLLQVADRIRNDPSLRGNVQRQHTLLSILGIDDKMLPLLQQGRVAIEGYIEEAKKHGYLTEQQAQQATALQRAYSGLTLSVENTGLAIGAQMSQWLTPMINSWSDWLDKLRSTPGALDIFKTKWDAVGADLMHGLLGDGAAWQDTGNKLMDSIVKGMIAGNDTFSQLIGKLSDVLGQAAEGFGKALVKSMQDSIQNDPDFQTIVKFLQMPGQIHDQIFGPSGPEEDLRNRPSPKNWQEFWNNINPFSGAGGALHGLKNFVFGKSDQERISDAVSAYEKLGRSHADAVAIAANQFRESGLQNKTGDSGLAQGISQWHPDRQANFRRLFGHDIKDATLDEQYKFTDWELRNKYPEVDDLIKQAKTVPEKSAILSRYYESPKDEVGEARERASLAERIENSIYPVGAAQAAEPPVVANPAVAAPKAPAVAPAVIAPKKPVGAPNVTASPAGEMLTLPDINVTAPAPRANAPIPPKALKAVPIPPLVPGAAAGKQSSLGLDSSHTVQVHFVNTPTGTRTGLTQAEGPANVSVRTQYAMDNLS